VWEEQERGRRAPRFAKEGEMNFRETFIIRDTPDRGMIIKRENFLMKLKRRLHT